jgi:site-specific recombinase XerD
MSTALIPAPMIPWIPAQASDDSEAIRLWLHGKAELTVTAYQADIDVFLGFVARPLASVTLADLQAYSDSLQGSAASKARRLSAVKSLLAFCHKIGYTAFNVGAALPVPGVRDGLAQRIMDEGDVLTMIATAEGRDKVLLRFMYESGCRVSEVCGLRWQDVTARGEGQVQVSVFGKRGKTRNILVSDVLMALRGERGPADFVFTSRTGKQLDETAALRIVRKATRRCGIQDAVSPHWFRHACASHALEHGANVALVREQLGHSSLETTSRYAHARPGTGLVKYLRLPKARVARPVLGSLGQSLVNLGCSAADAMARLERAGIPVGADFSEDLFRQVMSIQQ